MDLRGAGRLGYRVYFPFPVNSVVLPFPEVKNMT